MILIAVASDQGNIIVVVSDQGCATGDMVSAERDTG